MADRYFRQFHFAAQVAADLAEMITDVATDLADHVVTAETQINYLTGQVSALAGAPQIHGCDIWIKDKQPDVVDDYVWIDTTAIQLIIE